MSNINPANKYYTHEFTDRASDGTTVKYRTTTNSVYDASTNHSRWIASDENRGKGLSFLYANVVYDNDAASKYGDEYGTPDEFFTLESSESV